MTYLQDLPPELAQRCGSARGQSGPFCHGKKTVDAAATGKGRAKGGAGWCGGA
jgi:hypothetical protein